MYTKFDEDAQNGSVLCLQSFSFNVHYNVWSWPLTSKVNRVHFLHIVNMYATFDEDAHNGLVSILFTRLLLFKSIVT